MATLKYYDGTSWVPLQQQNQGVSSEDLNKILYVANNMNEYENEKSKLLEQGTLFCIVKKENFEEPPSSENVPVSFDFYIGDVNQDGFVTEEDVNIIQDVVTNGADLTKRQFVIADTNNNGEITIVDAQNIRQEIQSGYDYESNLRTAFEYPEDENGISKIKIINTNNSGTQFVLTYSFRGNELIDFSVVA